MQPTKRLVAKLREKKPGAKVIGFPRGAGRNIPRYVEETGVDAVSLATRSTALSRATKSSRACRCRAMSTRISCSQGGAALDREVDEVLTGFGAGPLIFNLGHGILPQTPIAHVERMLKRVRG